jgi:hypothetical protein
MEINIEDNDMISDAQPHFASRKEYSRCKIGVL